MALIVRRIDASVRPSFARLLWRNVLRCFAWRAGARRGLPTTLTDHLAKDIGLPPNELYRMREAEKRRSGWTL